MKISTKFMKMIFCSIGVLLFLTPLTVLAQTKVVVIPLGGDMKPLKNIITVAKANGNFTDPVAAVNSITDASATNPYLVVIGPGVYTITQTLWMREYVDIVGSGENVTRLIGAVSTTDIAPSAIIRGANNAILSSLTVENTGGSNFSIALYNNVASPTVRNVTLKASGGWSYGVYNTSSSPTIIDVTITVSGGSSHYGVYNYPSSSPTMTNVTITASGGVHNLAVENQSSSSPTMTNVSISASGGSSRNFAVTNGSSSSPTMTGVTAIASGGTQAYGVISFSSSPVIRRSTMSGDTKSLSTSDGTATVSQSTLINGVFVAGTGTNTCVACDNGSGIALNGNCL